jgi:hypothetical protein
MAALLMNVMREVCCVPDRYVLVVGALPVDEAADICRSIPLRLACLTRSSRYSVIDLPIVMPQDPHITACEGVWARDQHVSITGRGVLDPPSSAACGISGAHDLSAVDVPVRGDNRWRVVLPNHVVSFGEDVEVEPPVDMVMMNLADARIFYSREPKARADGPVVVEAPLADVPIIACL